MVGCCDPLYRRLHRPGDSAEQDKERRILLPVILFMLAQTSWIIAERIREDKWAGPFALGCASVLLASAVGTAFVLLRMPGSYTTFVSVASLPFLFGILAVDLANSSQLRVRMWPTVVILMDMLVVFSSRRAVQMAVMAVTVIYLAVIAVEQATLFGPLKLGAKGEGTDGPPVCMCSDPPCADTLAESVGSWVISSAVFCLDFLVTRSFATGLRHQLSLVDASVRVSERVAELLAAYATDDARRVVAEEGTALPTALLLSFEQLLDNLDSYRVYLPDSLLQQQQQQQEADATFDSASCQRPVRPPGEGEAAPEVAICFTDIQSSTALWEAHPQGMYEGLKTHNQVMRDVCAINNGYEVKTIGDSFMVAFSSIPDAVRFGLDVQQELLRQVYPDDLLEHPLCERVNDERGEPLWGGLRVRIGIHRGPVRVESNPVTGRCDYFGPTVNTAARLEAVLRNGGMVAVSEAVVSALGSAGLEELGSPVVHDAGLRELKGVRESVKVWALVPRELARRVEVLSHSAEHGGGEGEAERVRGRTVSSVAALETSQGGSDCGFTKNRDGSLAQGRLRKIILRMRKSVASCAVARISLRSNSYALPTFVTAAVLAADRSQGVVDGVLSACVSVSWNASRACADHAAAARQFIGASFGVPLHLGAASGGVMHGSISAGRRSFATVAGGCIELAAALAEEAERCLDSALVTGAVADECAAAGAAYWAQQWLPPSGEPLLVYEVDVQAQSKWQLADDVGEDPQESEQWGDSFAALFRRACAASQGSIEAEDVLRELRLRAGDGGSNIDERAHRLAERVERGSARSRPMPFLWEPDDARPSLYAAGRRSVAASVLLHSPTSRP